MVRGSRPLQIGMKQDNKRTELLVGLFLLCGLALLAGLILRFGSIREYFREKERYQVIFDDASGLSAMAPVRIGGLRIGRVAGPPRLTPEGKVMVPFYLYTKENFQIPQGARVTIAKEGLLGDSYISITPPSPLTGEFYAPGTTLTGAAITGLDALQESAGKITADIETVLAELSVGVKSFNAAISTLEREVLTPVNTENIKAALATLNASLERLDKKFLTEENASQLRETLAHLRTSSESIAQQSSRLEPLLTKSKAAVTKVGQAADSFKETGTAFKTAAEKAGHTFGKASNGDGLFAALLDDPQLRDDVKALAVNLRRRGILFYRDKPSPADTAEPTPPRRRAPATAKPGLR